jgi:hypothetical protein
MWVGKKSLSLVRSWQLQHRIFQDDLSDNKSVVEDTLHQLGTSSVLVQFDNQMGEQLGFQLR